MPEDRPQAEPDRDEVQDAAERRKHDRSEHTENILDEVEQDFGEHDYPVRGEELAATYSTEEIDLPNETESLGSVFDRLADEQFDSAEDVREAVYGEITGGPGAAGEANSERDLGEIEDDATADSNRDI